MRFPGWRFEARSAFVVLDDEPYGATMLLMDATGAYHRQMVRELESHGTTRLITPLMRLQNPDYTKIILVTLRNYASAAGTGTAGKTFDARKLSSFAWVINKSIWAADTMTRYCKPDWRAKPSR